MNNEYRYIIIGGGMTGDATRLDMNLLVNLIRQVRFMRTGKKSLKKVLSII